MNLPSLYTRTLCSLKVSQIAYLVLRRWLPATTGCSLKATPLLRQGIQMDSDYPCVTRSVGVHTFCFLNRTKVYPNGVIDWSCRDMPKLWRYNLHYFDYLNDRSLSFERKKQLVTDWIAHTYPGMEDAWEPYTVSLRIVNWIKFFKETGMTVQREWIESLYRQALWLERNVEYHLLANHYLKNGVALFFAGMYFEGSNGDRWLKKGLRILREELEEQFLSDGGHYERSPMYHSICVVDYLDVLNLMISSNGARTFDERDHFKARISRALEFLNDICLPDDDIPLFNDSALGIAPAPKTIFKYADKVIGYKRPDRQSNLSVIQKSQCGYFVLRKGTDMMVIDCGDIGPTYQPGHAHCDTLSYELAVNGRRMIVDSGVYDYEPSPQRTYVRSTRAHNTVEIDDEEQSEIWGVFRVARQAKPIQVRVEKTSDNRAIFEGAHDGYTRCSGKLVHHRSIDYDGRSNWQVVDRIQGSGRHRAKSYIHLHPDFRVRLVGQRVSIQDASGIEWAVLEALSNEEITVEESNYYPEFGCETKNMTIVCTRSGEVPMSLGYRITTASRELSAGM